MKLSAIVVKQAEPEQEQSDPDDPAVPVTAKSTVRAAVSPVVLKKEDEKTTENQTVRRENNLVLVLQGEGREEYELP